MFQTTRNNIDLIDVILYSFIKHVDVSIVLSVIHKTLIIVMNIRIQFCLQFLLALM